MVEFFKSFNDINNSEHFKIWNKRLRLRNFSHDIRHEQFDKFRHPIKINVTNNFFDILRPTQKPPRAAKV